MGQPLTYYTTKLGLWVKKKVQKKVIILFKYYCKSNDWFLHNLFYKKIKL